MLKQLAVANFSAAALAATLSTASATGVGCPIWQCGSNGSSYQGVLLSGVTLQNASGKHGVNTVILPSGEIVNLR